MMKKVLSIVFLVGVLAAPYCMQLYAQVSDDAMKTVLVRIDRLEKRVRDLNEKIDNLVDSNQDVMKKLDELVQGQKEVVKEVGTLRMRIR